jgi:catechol 2,3-dioxygenase-like lactoylglutathione lyase family enzyme
MRINVTSVLVDDQTKALAFYADVLGFVPKHDVPVGEHRWLTVVSPEQPDGTELLLEPSDTRPSGRSRRRSSPTASRGRRSRSPTSTPSTSRLVALGVRFTQPPIEMGPVTTAVFDDTCGNLIQIATTP